MLVNTQDVLSKLGALLEHYERLQGSAATEVEQMAYNNMAQGVRNSIHEVELLEHSSD